MPRSLLTAALLLPATALALPWNVDMADADTVKAYEQPMRPLPEGVMSQEHLLTPVAWRRNYAWTSPFRTTHTWPDAIEGRAFVPDDAATQATGARMYEVYCWPCHGDGQNLGPVSTAGYPAVAVLSGPDGRLQNQANGHVYLTIRNGSLSKLMPSYGYAMTETEMWSLLAWMRTAMPDAQYTPPAPPPAQEATE